MGTALNICISEGLCACIKGGDYLSWFEGGLQKKADGWTYREIAEHYDLTVDGVRSRFRREKSKRKSKTQDNPPEPTSLLDLLTKHKKGCDVGWLAKRVQVSERVLRAKLEDLRDDGYIITDTDGMITLSRFAPVEENKAAMDWQGDQIITQQEIADELGITQKVVAVHLKRSLRKLGKILANRV